MDKSPHRVLRRWPRWQASLAAVLAGWFATAVAAEAPGAPGSGSAWTTAAKQGLGTSTTIASKVWYTMGQGITHEVYYPRVDTPNVQDLQFIVTDGSSFVDLERDATDHQVQLVDPSTLIYRQINTAKSGKYRITKTYLTDPDRSTLLVDTRFEALSGGPYQLYVLYNPSLNGSGLGDTAANQGDALVASDGNVASALMVSGGFSQRSSGYSGSPSDGLVDLNADKRLDKLFDSASAPGNIVQIGRVDVGSDTAFTLALGFGASRPEALGNAQTSLATTFADQQAKYADGWHGYLAALKPAPSSVVQQGLVTQYSVALMVLKALEDKTFPGAGIASLATPWGDVVNADSCCVYDDGHGGYQSVFARDLYEVATAQLAAGDRKAANRYLDFLFNRQQRGDGSVPRHSKIDGDALGGDTQMDEVAYPIILAWQLDRTDAASWARIKKSADFLVAHGPFTAKERWEEQSGFSPSTIAAEIAALACAADIAKKNGDPGAAYLNTADDWQRNIENWTFTTSGLYFDHRYYIRIGDDQNPNDNGRIDIVNGGGNHDEREIVDAGFLELVRLGVKPPTEPRIVESLPEIDSVIKTATPKGDLYHRYNFDGYGERDDNCLGFPAHHAGRGGFWPLLSGERGEYELARGNPAGAKDRLKTLANAANAGFMIPEQVFDRTVPNCGFALGEGTGSATPLAWSMAQFVRLALSIDNGFPVETPSVVACRYGAHPDCPKGKLSFQLTVPPNTDGAGKSVFLAGEIHQFDPGKADWDPSGLLFTRDDATHWHGELSGVTGGAMLRYKYTLGDWASVEKGPGCQEIPNRTLSVVLDAGNTQTVADTVNAWASLPPCAGGAQVSLRVAVPSGTAATGKAVYIAGTLDRLQGNLPAWKPDGIQLTKQDDGHWSITLAGNPSTQVEYKFTLGDWSYGEKSGNCGEIPNRALTLPDSPGAQTIEVSVANWRNVPPCGN